MGLLRIGLLWIGLLCIGSVCIGLLSIGLLRLGLLCMQTYGNAIRNTKCEKSKIKKSIESDKIEWRYSEYLALRYFEYRHSISSDSINFLIFDFFQIRVYYGISICFACLVILDFGDFEKWIT